MEENPAEIQFVDEEFDMDHWEEHQSNIGDLCDTSKMNIIDYKKCLKMTIVVILIMIVIDILAFSGVVVRQDGTKEVLASGFWFIMMMGFTAYSSWHLGKLWKKRLLVFPIVIVIGILAAYIAGHLGPYLIDGIHLPVVGKVIFISFFSIPTSILLGYLGTTTMTHE